jgi:hypothetical protein
MAAQEEAMQQPDGAMRQLEGSAVKRQQEDKIAAQ